MGLNSWCLEDFLVHLFHWFKVEKLLAILHVIAHINFQNLTQADISSNHFMVKQTSQICPNVFMRIVLVHIFLEFLHIWAQICHQCSFKGLSIWVIANIDTSLQTYQPIFISKWYPLRIITGKLLLLKTSYVFNSIYKFNSFHGV